ncbi:MAG: hypothetical protein HY736_20360 [Verrucomicrobia bacterium]|nr:hypothetical protein [Verrucomicrobiota bacterium]
MKFSPPGASFKRSGRDDSQLGLTYAILPESAEAAAVTFRLGAIIAGGYSVPTTLPPINPGDGASGIEASFAAGNSEAPRRGRARVRGGAGIAGGYSDKTCAGGGYSGADQRYAHERCPTAVRI